ncbi:unnamed protein product [Scytosiphon promiscuus]
MSIGQRWETTPSSEPSPSSPSCRGDYGDADRHLHEDAFKLENYGIPDQLVDSYAKRGIRSLFPWQAHCLRVDEGKPLGGGNLVYSAPTSGGKTLVAELLLLRALLKHSGTMALLVVPYVALALEKRDYLRDVWSPLQLNVQAYHGGEGGDGSDMEGVNVAICTIEKANSIVNRLAEEKRLKGLSAVVVDEMHLIGDKSRGFLLELMLTKQRLLCPQSTQASKRLICLSATLPNIERLAKWLNASLYRTEYRPVHLRHFVCDGRVVYRPSRMTQSGNGPGPNGHDGRLEKVVGGEIKKVGQTSSMLDPDGVVDLVKDALARDMSVLVFCSTKKWCQQTANLLAKEVLSDRSRATAIASEALARKSRVDRENESRGEGKPSSTGFAPAKSLVQAVMASDMDATTTPKSTNSGVREGIAMLQGVWAETQPTTAIKTGARQGRAAECGREMSLSPTPASLVREKLRETPVGLDADLSYLVGAGIAFHHSGLVVEERSILEDAFRQGSIRVLVATSTLAAGVNLPAHRVIIRSPSIGMGLLDSTRYHQMAGRSGRAGVSRGEEGGKAARGVDTASGESFLIIPKNVKFTLADASKLISAPLPKLESALRDAKGGGLERALLEVVVSKTVTSSAAARSFCAKTLLAVQIEEKEMHEACDSAMEYLLEQNFVVKQGGSGEGCPQQYDVAPTQLGRATFFSGLSPSAAVDVFQSLDKACQNFAVASELHSLVLVTPLDGIEPNWRRFREEYLAFSKDDPVRVVGELIGVELGVLVSAAGQTGPKYGQRTYDICRGSSRRVVDLQPYRRLYGAMLLQQAVEEVPVRNMAARLGIERGTLQALQKEASVFCGMVVCFCRHLQWHELANVLYSFQDRLGYSAKPELLPLVRLSRDLPPFRARALLEAGYPSPLELATANAGPVADVLLRCAPFRSAGWDESVERHRLQQANRLAQNVIRLARLEVMRQIRRTLVSSTSAS